MAIQYTPYERSTLDDARVARRNPFLTPLSALARVFDEEENTDPDLLRASTAIDPRLARVARIALDRIHTLVLRTLTMRSVRRAFARAGHRRVRTLADIPRLALWEIDEVAEGIGTRYVLAAGALGMLAGTIGAKGAVLDAPLALGLALRCVDDVALHYGFDPRAKGERAFVFEVLASAFGVERRASFEQLAELATKLHRRWTREDSRGLSLPLLFTFGRRLVSFVAKRRGPRVGQALAATSFGGANAWLLAGVAKVAQAAYRERFITRNGTRDVARP